jgi:hypothetical protein
MAKKRKKKDIVKEEKEKDDTDESLSFKHWVGRTIIIGFILLGVVYLFERYLNQPVLVDAFLAIVIVLFIGFTHEALHYYRAVRLGYKPSWYRTKVRMGFTIEHHSKGKWAKDKKKIARMPYIVLVPISLAILLIGFYMNEMFLMVAGGGSLLLHAISYPTEGKDE